MIRGFNEATEKSVRVFISSTFSDFYNEREVLATSVFPRLRDHFANRGISVAEIDLRWGLTKQTKSKDTINACLDQIDACYPYFVGLSGGRDGWTPSKEDLEAAERVSTVFPTGLDREMSITELEFHAGAFSKGNEFALFFINDITPFHDERAFELREKIEATFSESAKHYSDISLFSDEVYSALVSVINKRFPPEKAGSELDPDYRAQLACLHRHVDDYAAGNDAVDSAIERLRRGRNVYLHGEKGTGKSASVAFMAKELGLSDEADVFFYFCGATNNGSSEKQLYQSLEKFLASVYGEQDDVGSGDPLDMVHSLLSRATLTRPLFLLIDAIDQLHTRRSVCDALFALSETYPQVACLCSSTQREPFIRADHDRIELKGLSDLQARKMIEGYLSRYGKNLGDDDVSLLLNGAVCEKPLLLQGALNELRIVGKFDTITESVESLSSIGSVSELLEQIVHRLSAEAQLYGSNRSSVLKILEAIRTAHRGVTEDELIRICSVPTILWISLQSAFKPFLFQSDGRIRFNHQLVEQSAKNLVDDPRIESEVLARKVEEYRKGPASAERLCELAFVCSAFYDKDEFALTLCASETLSALVSIEPDTLVRYLTVFSEDDRAIEEGFVRSANSLSASKRTCEKLSWILRQSGCFGACIAFVDKLAEIGVESTELVSSKARAYYDSGAPGYEDACKTYDAALQTVDEEKDPSEYARLLFSKSIVLKSAGDHITALDCNLRASRLYRLANAGDYGFAWCLSNLGRLLFLFGEDGAEEVLAESRRIGEQASGLHSPAYARLLCFDQFFTVSGDLEKADELVSFSASTLLEHLGEGPDYAWAMANCAVLFAFQGDWAEARRANEDCARINDRAVKTCKHTYSFTSKNNELVFDFIDNRPVKASFDQLLSDASEELGPRHPYVANVIANRGFVESIDDPEEGTRSILRAAGILDDAIKPDCPDALYLKLCASLLSQDAPLSSTAASALKEAAASDMVISALLGERPAARPAVQLARNNGAELYLTPFSLANRQTETTLSHH